MHFNMVLDQSDTVKISDKQLPYTWNYALGGVRRDTVLTDAGTYYHTEKTHGGCYNQEKLVLIVYPTYLFPLDTTICETQLPFKWQSGPAEHQNDDLYGEVGMTKTIEYRYNSVNNTDSIYRLNLTVDAAPKATEYHWVCSGTPELIRGKVYGNTTATIFFLKTKGRKRGYVEKHDVEVANHEPIVFTTTPEIKELIDKL